MYAEFAFLVIPQIVNRHLPFGNHVREGVAKLPKYELTIEQVWRAVSANTDLL